jgi:uracil-DNA glycosylase
MITLDRPHAPIPERPTLAKLHEALAECRACDLWEGATQGVMGEGARHASLMLVGEQPGDREDVELAVVKPAALICLGATAAQQLLGSKIRIGRDRGRPVDSDLAELVTLTTHPSAILRADDEDRDEAMAMFVADLSAVRKWLGEHNG